MKTIQLIPLILLFLACESSEEFFESNLSDYYNSNKNSFQEFTIDAKNGGRIVGQDGIRVTFPPNSLTNAAGNTIQGDVTIVLKEYMSLAEMFMSNLQTVDENNDMLITAGSLFLRASQNGEELKINYAANVTAEIPARMNVGPYAGKMQSFAESDNTTDDQFIWRPVEGPVNFNPSAENYILQNLIDGYLNCDAFYNYPGGQRTQFEVEVLNSMTRPDVFLFVKDLPSLVKIPSYSDHTAKSYYNSVPTNIEGTLLAISYRKGRFSFASQEIKVLGDDVFTLSLQEGTEKELEDLLLTFGD